MAFLLECCTAFSKSVEWYRGKDSELHIAVINFKHVWNFKLKEIICSNAFSYTMFGVSEISEIISTYAYIHSPERQSLIFIYPIIIIRLLSYLKFQINQKRYWLRSVWIFRLPTYTIGIFNSINWICIFFNWTILVYAFRPTWNFKLTKCLLTVCT
jgi:hypothetical protein